MIIDLCGIGKKCGYATPINMLPDDVLIDIFDFLRKKPYLSWKWHILVHVCQRWRRIVFASPRRLDLRIHCTNGTPVRKLLDIWPAFPIIIDYVDHKIIAFSDDDDVIAALKYPDRVCYIWLDELATDLLLEGMATVMQESFPALTHLHIFSDGDPPVLPDRFLGGSAPCLQEIGLCGIPFPALPKFLLSSSGLVRLELNDMPQTCYISPEDMVAVLATSTSLKTLVIGFQPSASRPDRIRLPPATRTVLRVLTSFSFVGVQEYLECLAACLDAPRLNSISIRYSNLVIDFQVPQLCKFINRSEITKRSPPRRCDITLQYNSICFDLDTTIDRGDVWEDSSRIQVSFTCQELDEQVSLITQVLSRISPLLSNVIHFTIDWSGIPCLWEGTDDIGWLPLLHLFTSVRTWLVSTEFAGHIARALEDVTGEMVTELLPALNLLCLEGLPRSSVAEFCAARQLSGCPVCFVGTQREFGKRLKSYQSK
jgi:hypothetical protein